MKFKIGDRIVHKSSLSFYAIDKTFFATITGFDDTGYKFEGNKDPGTKHRIFKHAEDWVLVGLDGNDIMKGLVNE